MAGNSKGSSMPSLTEMRLSNALLRLGQDRLAEVWDLKSSEVSRKLNSETGIKLAQFAAAIDAVGAEVIFREECVVVQIDEYEALQTLARKALEKSKQGT